MTADLNSRYRSLKTEDDLVSVADYDLLVTCNRMGLITDHVLEVFKFINYERNHSSAAHPSENSIGPYDLLSWLDNCIKYAINAEPNEEALKLKRLFYNLRNGEIPKEDYSYIGKSIAALPTVMVEDFLSSIFGMYTDPKTTTNIITNITGLAKYVWNACTEEKKHFIGEKYGLYRKNGDADRKERANKFLTIVGGLSYKDEDSISYELRDTLANLMTTHNSLNNFYNEAPWARHLKDMLPANGVIPESILKEWVKTIVICYCGNGMGYREGVDEGALPYYEYFIKQFDNKTIIEMLNLMSDPVFYMDLDTKKANKRFRALCKKLADNTSNVLIADALKYLVDCVEQLSNAHKTTAYKELLDRVNKLSFD